jgi:type II secretory pathway component PulF
LASVRNIDHALLGLADALAAGIDAERAARALPGTVGTAVARAAREGHSLTRVLMETRLIDDTEQALLDAGEHMGALPLFLREVVEGRRGRRALFRQTLVALAYPILLLVIGSVVLPLPQLVSQGVGAYARSALPLPAAILGIALVVVALSRAPATRARLRPVVMRAASRVPIAGRVLQAASRANFYRTLSRLTGAGLAITRALPLAFSTTTWPKEASDRCVSAIFRGAELASALGEAGAFPAEDLARIANHALTGTLERGLNALATDTAERAARGRATLVVVLTGAILALTFFAIARGVLAAAEEAIIAPLERAMSVE